MSPIMIRPVKEQIEHDRVIRVLDHLFRAKYFAVDANVGDEKKASIKIGPQTHHPDLVLTAPTAPKKVLALVEVESGESVNKMEAMAEWGHFSRAKAPFQLYVPAATIDIARRIIEDFQLSVTELWSYVSVGDEIHFHLVGHVSKSFADGVQPGDTMPAMPVYIPPPPPPPPPPPVVEKPKVEKAKAEKAEPAAANSGNGKAAKAGAKATPAAPAPKAEPVKPAPKAEPAKPVAKANGGATAPAKGKTAKPVAVEPARPAAKPAKAAAKSAPAKPTAKAPVKKVAKPAPKPAPKPVKRVTKPAAKAAKAPAKAATKAKSPVKSKAKAPVKAAKSSSKPAKRPAAKASAPKHK